MQICVLPKLRGEDGGAGMSVVVRMEMPKCCEDCAAEYDCMACGITGTLWYEESEEFNPSNGRLPDCPIICSLPEGHGRLVDADAYDYPGDLKWEPTIVPAEAERSET